MDEEKEDGRRALIFVGCEVLVLVDTRGSSTHSSENPHPAMQQHLSQMCQAA